MKKGEKSILTCKPEYAYGKSGSPPKIPADATLNFEVELLSWKSVKDIMGDGGIIKTVVADGSGWNTPRDQDEVLGGCPFEMPFIALALRSSAANYGKRRETHG